MLSLAPQVLKEKKSSYIFSASFTEQFHTNLIKCPLSFLVTIFPFHFELSKSRNMHFHIPEQSPQFLLRRDWLSDWDGHQITDL